MIALTCATRSFIFDDAIMVMYPILQSHHTSTSIPQLDEMGEKISEQSNLWLWLACIGHSLCMLIRIIDNHRCMIQVVFGIRVPI